MKEMFKKIEWEIILFEGIDVITTSPTNYNEDEDDIDLNSFEADY